MNAKSGSAFAFQIKATLSLSCSLSLFFTDQIRYSTIVTLESQSPLTLSAANVSRRTRDKFSRFEVSSRSLALSSAASFLGEIVLSHCPLTAHAPKASVFLRCPKHTTDWSGFTMENIASCILAARDNLLILNSTYKLRAGCVGENFYFIIYIILKKKTKMSSLHVSLR